MHPADISRRIALFPDPAGYPNIVEAQLVELSGLVRYLADWIAERHPGRVGPHGPPVPAPASPSSVRPLPCPFCGGTDFYLFTDPLGRIASQCGDCLAIGPRASSLTAVSYADAVFLAWNRRAPSVPVHARPCSSGSPSGEVRP